MLDIVARERKITKIHEISQNTKKCYKIIQKHTPCEYNFCIHCIQKSLFTNSHKFHKSQAQCTEKGNSIEIKPVLQQSCIHGKASLAYVLAIFCICEYNFSFVNTTFVFTESQAYQGFYPDLPPVNTVNKKKKSPPLYFYIFNKLILPNNTKRIC